MLYVFGHSDDCIEVRGDVESEFYHYDETPLEFEVESDGGVRLFTVEYDAEGEWRISDMDETDDPRFVVSRAVGEDSDEDACEVLGERVAKYSDLLTVYGDVTAMYVFGHKVTEDFVSTTEG